MTNLPCTNILLQLCCEQQQKKSFGCPPCGTMHWVELHPWIEIFLEHPCKGTGNCFVHYLSKSPLHTSGTKRNEDVLHRFWVRPTFSRIFVRLWKKGFLVKLWVWEHEMTPLLQIFDAIKKLAEQLVFLFSPVQKFEIHDFSGFGLWQSKTDIQTQRLALPHGTEFRVQSNF